MNAKLLLPWRKRIYGKHVHYGRDYVLTDGGANVVYGYPEIRQLGVHGSWEYWNMHDHYIAVPTKQAALQESDRVCEKLGFYLL